MRFIRSNKTLYYQTNNFALCKLEVDSKPQKIVECTSVDFVIDGELANPYTNKINLNEGLVNEASEYGF